MKTTKTFRLLAVLLALVLAFGAMPALAVEIDSGDYAAWTQSAVDDLYGRLMAAENYEDYIAIVETLSETVRTAFFNALTEEQQAALEEHAITLTPASEAFEPIVRFTKVGPLLPAPASGARMMRFAARNGGSSGSDSGIVLNKTAEKTDDGYKITLEAYATGSSTTVSHVDPVDIVLVLDVSGSMDEGMYSYSEVYEVKTRGEYYIYVNGRYKSVIWYDGWYYYDNGWYSVSPKTSKEDNDGTHVQFYEKVTSSTNKINALKSAVNGFIDNVAEKSPDSSIAIVKFAGSKTDEKGNGTYGWLGKSNYSQIVMDLTTVDKSGQAALKRAVNSFSPAGATAADYGMQHAQTIISGAKNDGRKKVVIMFTDGEPNHGNGFSETVANDAISASQNIKKEGATVYTIGVFSGADGTPVTSWNGVSDTNKYMHLVSSNYKDATSMETETKTATYPEGGKSYFLSAGSAGELNSIFQQISHEVGGPETKLDSSSYILDTVTPYFTMPEGTDAVKFYTMDCVGDGQFSSKQSAAGVTHTITGNTLKVTGFDFSANWCGPRDGVYSGKKLIVEFTVKPKAGFLGGNNVPTNVGETDGIYDKDGNSADSFTSPKVNVEIPDIAVTAEDKNVYLLGSVTDNDCKTNATAMCNGVNLLNEADYTGANAWKADFVEINSSVVKPTDSMTNDGTYTLNVTVTPKKSGEGSEGTPATAKPGTATANINVFKPELTFKDSTVEYKSTLVTPNENGYADNLQKTEWKHGETVDSSVTMIGTVPTLTKTYAPTAGVDSNIVIATDYVPVQVTVKIGETPVTSHTTFVHQACEDTACQWENVKNAADLSNPAFLLHVINVVGDLTITKIGLNQHTYTGEKEDQESAIFKVEGDNQTWYVAINANANGTGSVTLTGLKVGNYTVTELTGWTWRYGSSTLTSDNKNTDGTFKVNGGQTTTVTCANSNHNDKWLGGDNYANNVFGSGN